MPEVIEKTFSVGGSARLNLANIRGSVDIQPGSAGQISVQAVKDTSSGNADQTRIEIEQGEDGQVSVRTLYGFNGWNTFFRTPCKVDYTVQVPPHCTLEVEGVSNSTSIRGVSGEIKVASVSGRLTLQDLGGSLALTTVSGPLKGERLSGTLRLETVSGGVDLRQCDLDSIDSSTVSGRITLESGLGEGAYRFNSVSGEVRLILPAGTGCTVHSESVSGRVHSDLPVTASYKGRPRVLQINGGGADIRHNAISGGLWLKISPEDAIISSPPAETASVDEPEPDSTRERLAVLERIERGELTVAEGLQILAPE